MYPGKWGVEVPDKPAAAHAVTGEALTYGRLNERSNRLAQLLWARGLRRGEHVAIFMENSLRYFKVTWAALHSGLYLTTVNRYLTAEEAAYIIDNSESSALITSAPLAFCTVAQALGGTVVMMPRFDEVGALKAVVQPVSDTPADDELAEELLAYAREHLAHYKCPRRSTSWNSSPACPPASSANARSRTATGAGRGRGLFEPCKAGGCNLMAAEQRDAA